MDPEMEQRSPSSARNNTAKKKELLSGAMKRTSQWVFSHEIPSDITVIAGGTSFCLHKFPLVSKSGYISKKLSESTGTAKSIVEIPDVPGGAEAFELAAKFCYGISFEITSENIAALRCAAEFLEMTEDYATGNLIQRTESYTNEVALKTVSGAVSILHSSENLLPMAEEVRLVSRSIDSVAIIMCRDRSIDWWGEDLAVLRIDMFQRVLFAMIARGFKQHDLAQIVMLYAQKSLRGLEIFGKGRKKIEPRQEHEKRVVLETIVSLLPREKNSISVSFLSMLLRASIYLETTAACRLDLEKRVALQLAHAALDDLLIPSYSFTGDTLFDVEAVIRITKNFFESEREMNKIGYNFDAAEDYNSPSASDMERVTRLLENYLSELASDRNLSVTKFVDLAELIPEHPRLTEDGMYRAIDIYLKAHPSLSDMERKKLCSVMNCQKLSQEASAHAAQNERLPVQTIIQVLYYEQQRLREVVDNSSLNREFSLHSGKLNPKSSGIRSVVMDETSSLRKENQDLKLEILNMKMKLNELEKSSGNKSLSKPVSPLVTSHVTATDGPTLSQKYSFISSVSKKLGRFIRADGLLPGTRSRNKSSKLDATRYRDMYISLALHFCFG
ncbi:BTB/POZ domain-containing protein [Dorcoceras hygrometricum]|uniref:BTB/POZ domain-containing protein n=1 Tax=Dorcoceras hygrometricum TaxID=472368 RepID=A0A2Z7BD65_9LAMI|nr:BTB/POZ domain-containing protein [Dorcoceras hygrometricum]